MPHTRLAMTQEELESTLTCYQTQDMSESFRDRELSLIFPDAHSLATAWKRIPCSRAQTYFFLTNGYRATFLSVIGSEQLIRIADSSGGWSVFFDAFGNDKAHCLSMMVAQRFQFQLRSQRELGQLLQSFPSSAWYDITRLFTNLYYIVKQEKGLTGFLTEHFHGDANSLFHHELQPYVNFWQDDIELVFRRFPGRFDLYQQLHYFLEEYFKAPRDDSFLPDEPLSCMLLQLSSKHLAALLRPHNRYGQIPLADRPEVIKTIAVRRGRDPLINTTLLDYYLETAGPEFWTRAQWPLLLPAMNSCSSARAILSRLGDGADTLTFLNQYQTFVTSLTPWLDDLGVAKSFLDLINDPWKIMSDVNMDDKNTPACAAPFLLMLMLSALIWVMFCYTLKMPLKCTEMWGTYQELLDMFKDYPVVDPSALVKTYQGLVPYHQTLQTRYKGMMFSEVSGSKLETLSNDALLERANSVHYD